MMVLFWLIEMNHDLLRENVMEHNEEKFNIWELMNKS